MSRREAWFMALCIVTVIPVAAFVILNVTMWLWGPCT